MRIVFMGTPEFALPSLRILLERDYQVSAVVTAPDRPRGRGQAVSFTSVKEFAREQSLPLLQPEKLSDPQFVSHLTLLAPDLIVVVAFRILPNEVFSIPRLGAFNLHASLLPKYRGAAPINWAIINGESETGVTTFFLREKVDTGAVLLQARVRIGENETAGELHDKLSEVGAEIVLQTVRLIELGKARPRTQDEGNASPAPKIFTEDCRIDWSGVSSRVHNFVRGLSPYPAAWTTHADRTIKIYRTEKVAASAAGTQAGEVVAADGLLLHVATGDGVLAVLELQQEGRKRMTAGEFLRGYKIAKGGRFA